MSCCEPRPSPDSAAMQTVEVCQGRKTAQALTTERQACMHALQLLDALKQQQQYAVLESRLALQGPVFVFRAAGGHLHCCSWG